MSGIDWNLHFILHPGFRDFATLNKSSKAFGMMSLTLTLPRGQQTLCHFIYGSFNSSGMMYLQDNRDSKLTSPKERQRVVSGGWRHAEDQSVQQGQWAAVSSLRNCREVEGLTVFYSGLKRKACEPARCCSRICWSLWLQRLPRSCHRASICCGKVALANLNKR